MTTPEAWAELGEAAFVRLTTYKRNGDAVSSAMWIAPLGDDLVMSTPAQSAKVKRLRRNARVELTVSDRMGKVADDAVIVPAIATVQPAPEDVANGTRAILAKYGIQWRAMKVVEWVAARGKNRERVLLRISRDD